MVKRLHIPRTLTGIGLLLAAVFPSAAQYGLQIPPLPTGTRPPRQVVVKAPQKPSLPVTFSIPVGPLGFSIPGDSYLLRKQSLVSLDFLSDDRLLFTFHVAGLMPREADDPEGQKQQIRAVVLSLPDGKVEAQAEWVVPDRFRYLWMLNDGHFLLRGPEGLEQGDGELKLRDYLHTARRLLWIEMDPGQKLIITNSLDAASSEPSAGETEGPPEADPPGREGSAKDSGQQILVARTLKRATGEEIRVSRVPWTAQTNDWPMNSEGYLERSKEKGDRWILNLNSFAGGHREVAQVDSNCTPRYDFVSDRGLLVSRCDPQIGWMLGLMSMDGKWQWQVQDATNAIWATVVAAQDGSRVARETMLLNRPAYRYKRLLGVKDFRGQVVTVFDMHDGQVMMEAPLSPMFDGGGNVAISPSGRRVAVLNAGAIQVYQLPPVQAVAASIRR